MLKPLEELPNDQTPKAALPVQERLQLRRRRILLLIFWVVLGASILYLLCPYPFGMLIASIDYTRGHHEVQSWGLPFPWSREFRGLLRERYGVVVNTVGGCM